MKHHSIVVIEYNAQAPSLQIAIGPWVLPFGASPQLPVHVPPCGNPAQFEGQVAPVTRVLFGGVAQLVV